MASRKPSKKPVKMAYDCSKCGPAFCCSFPVIELSKAEARVMAEHKGMSMSAFEKKYLKRNTHKPDNKSNVFIFKQKKHPDKVTKSICTFFKKGVGCTMYDVRPETCRAWGNDGKCNIYDFLASMRKHTADPNYVPTRLEI